VADGVGGMDFGEFASGYTICCIKRWWDTRIKILIVKPKPLKKLIVQVNKELEELIKDINNDIFQYGISHGLKGGTTLSLVFIYDNSFILKHTGDSRIYMFAGELLQLTKDQSWVEREVDKGIFTKEQAELNPMRNILTMCLGVFTDLKLQSLLGFLPRGAVFILCSDGLYRYFNASDIKTEIAVLKADAESSAQDIANKLLKKVISKGAHDNISIIIVKPI